MCIHDAMTLLFIRHLIRRGLQFMHGHEHVRNITHQENRRFQTDSTSSLEFMF